jgi:hypothetical protein
LRKPIFHALPKTNKSGNPRGPKMDKFQATDRVEVQNLQKEIHSKAQASLSRVHRVWNLPQILLLQHTIS